MLKMPSMSLDTSCHQLLNMFETSPGVVYYGSYHHPPVKELLYH